MKHSYFSNGLFPIIFSVVETVVCQKLIHVYAYDLAIIMNLLKETTVFSRRQKIDFRYETEARK